MARAARYTQIAADFVRALRGKRSQAAFSRKLGYASNIVYRWENGRCFPKASVALRCARRSGVDVAAALQLFFHSAAPLAGVRDPSSARGLAALLERLRGSTPIVALARDSGLSRFAISRWLKGSAQPNLPELLALVDVATLRMLDFVACFTDPGRMPSVAEAWRSLCASRDAAFARPWSHAVLRALELTSYRALSAHEPGFIAQRLGIELEEERSCLELLLRSGQVKRAGKRLRVDDNVTIDLRTEQQRLQALKAFWLDVARQKLESGQPGVFGFNVFAVSAADLEALRQMHVAYFHQMQARIAQSEPCEHVALFSTQLVRLDG